MSSQQMDEWFAFYRIEPWGIAVLDVLLAHFKAIFVNANLPKGRKREKTDRFLLWPEKKKKEAEFIDPFEEKD